MRYFYLFSPFCYSSILLLTSRVCNRGFPAHPWVYNYDTMMKFLQPELWLTLACSPAWAVACTLQVDLFFPSFQTSFLYALFHWFFLCSLLHLWLYYLVLITVIKFKKILCYICSHILVVHFYLYFLKFFSSLFTKSLTSFLILSVAPPRVLSVLTFTPISESPLPSHHFISCGCLFHSWNNFFVYDIHWNWTPWHWSNALILNWFFTSSPSVSLFSVVLLFSNFTEIWQDSHLEENLWIWTIIMVLWTVSWFL